jgi:hypothetical protein
MSHLLKLIKALTILRSQKEIDEAYLNESVDICDVERRMREIEFRKNNDSSIHPLYRWSVQ